jgi:hypothetical protein
MNAGASTHSVVAEQWVCACLRRQTVRVPSRKSRQDSESLFAVEPAEYLRRLFDDVEFSYLVVVAAELGVADLFAPGPRSIADLCGHGCRCPVASPRPARRDGWRLLSLFGWLHLIHEGHRHERDVKQPQARLAPHLRSQHRQSKESHDVYINED